jgi:uncharacterized damage-inducible protein DinB
MTVERNLIEVQSGFASREAGLFIAQLDALSSYLARDLADITPAELQWQPAPGQNTIGMLLAHIAIVEVFWFQAGVLGIPDRIDPVLGIGRDDDGIPLPAGSPPPAGLAGKPLSFYQDLLQRARTFARQTATSLTDADIETERDRVRRNGTREHLNVRWVIFHVLEHQAGHYGQVLTLRHQYRDLSAAADGNAQPIT